MDDPERRKVQPELAGNGRRRCGVPSDTEESAIGASKGKMVAGNEDVAGEDVDGEGRRVSVDGRGKGPTLD